MAWGFGIAWSLANEERSLLLVWCCIYWDWSGKQSIKIGQAVRVARQSNLVAARAFCVVRIR